MNSQAEEGRVRLAMERFDAANAEDPNLEPDGSPKELVYGQRMSEWLDRLDPNAPDEVRLAVHSTFADGGFHARAIRQGGGPISSGDAI